MRVNITFSDGTYRNLNNPSKRKIAGLITVANDKMGDISGTCKVTYSKDYTNEFEFDSAKDFRFKIDPCLDKELLADFT